MGVRYRDYYETLGVPRTATQEEIQKAFRTLARKFHPDINKEAGAESRFKELNEAYEVLKDPEKRKKYDTLGSNWQNGQDFTPPPGWGGARSRAGTDFGAGGADFSDFFESVFGGGFGGFGGTRSGARRVSRGGQDVRVRIDLSLEEAWHGGSKAIELETSDPSGQRVRRPLEFTIPPGVQEGTKIRLEGKGSPGSGGGPPGNLLLEVHINPHAVFRMQGFDVERDLLLTPWEAALGANVELETLDTPVTLSVPPGISSGQKLRITRKGLRNRHGERGDLFARVLIVMPKTLSVREKELFQKLADESSFKPRS